MAGAEAMVGISDVRAGATAAGIELIERATERLAALDDFQLAARLDACFVLGMSLLLAERPRAAKGVFVRALMVARRPARATCWRRCRSGGRWACRPARPRGGCQRGRGGGGDRPHAGRRLPALLVAVDARLGPLGARRDGRLRRVAAECEQMAPSLDEDSLMIRTGRANIAALRSRRSRRPRSRRCLRPAPPAGADRHVLVDVAAAAAIRAALACGRDDDARRWADHLDAHAARLAIPAAVLALTARRAGAARRSRQRAAAAGARGGGLRGGRRASARRRRRAPGRGLRWPPTATATARRRSSTARRRRRRRRGRDPPADAAARELRRLEASPPRPAARPMAPAAAAPFGSSRRPCGRARDRRAGRPGPGQQAGRRDRS